jgi:hypothetical protein
MERIADGRLRIRYFNADDPLVWPRTNHRYEPLADLFFRLGTVNWKWSAVTFNERTIHQIEIFYPDGEATPDRDQGRPSSKDLIVAQGKRLLADGWDGSLTAFAEHVRLRVLQVDPNAPGTSLSTVRNNVRDTWNRRKQSV